MAEGTWALACLATFVVAGLICGQGAILEGAAYLTWPLLLIWLLSRSKQKCVVHDPKGQQLLLADREARRRVETSEGWSFEPDPDPERR
jgi:membrane-associated PAP2 superfamily phosphatase